MCKNPGIYRVVLAILFMIRIVDVQAGEIANEKPVLINWLTEQVNKHPSILASMADLDAASFNLIAADKALFNPELEFDAERTDINSAAIGVSQTIDWGGSREARTDVARSLKAAARFGFETERRKVAEKFLNALSGYHTNLELKALAEQGNALMDRSAGLAAQRYDAGDLTQVEVDLANLSYAQARFKLADAVSEYARNEMDLIALTGSAERNWPAFLSLPPVAEFLIQDLEKTVQQLPAMRQVMSSVDAARARIKLRTSEAVAMPNISVRAGKEDKESLLGLTLSIPLQFRNNFNAEIDVANAQMIMAKRQSMDAFRNYKKRLEYSYFAYRLNRETWLAWQQSGAGSLQEQIDLLERLWNAGELSTSDYLVQLRQSLETKTSAIEQREKMWMSWISWLVSSGKIEDWLNAGEKNE